MAVVPKRGRETSILQVVALGVSELKQTRQGKPRAEIFPTFPNNTKLFAQQIL